MKIENILKEHSKSVTKERIDIFSFLQTKHIFSANDILISFKDLWRASVFRTINLFLEIWVIRRISLWEKQETYELNEEDQHHEHMKCEKCNEIISFDSDDICKKIMWGAKKMGFIVKEHSIWILGTCRKCSSFLKL